MLYAVLKFLHVVAVIVWVGPPIGAYYFLFRARRSQDEAKILWSERVAERVLWVEHIALVLMITTGFLIVQQSSWALLAVPWLQKKLALFSAVFIFELYDIWFAHRFMKRLLQANVPLSDPRWKLADRLRRRLIAGAIPVGALLLPLILWFAISKQ